MSGNTDHPELIDGIAEGLEKTWFPIISEAILEAYWYVYAVCLVFTLFNYSSRGSGKLYRLITSMLCIIIAFFGYRTGRLMPDYSSKLWFEFAPAILAGLGLNGISSLVFVDDPASDHKSAIKEIGTLKDKNKVLAEVNESLARKIDELKDELGDLKKEGTDRSESDIAPLANPSKT